MSLAGCSQFSIEGKSTLNNVNGHQLNGTITANVINLNNQTTVERTKYDEFDYVKTGHIIPLKTLDTEAICSRDLQSQTWRIKGRKTFQTIKLHNIQRSKYTAVIYEGEGAERIWENDFQKFSHTRSPLVAQLFGINRSEIPMLIFHHELIPCAQFFNGKSIWMDIYITHLIENMKCKQGNLWMNTSSGVLSSGPNGPPTPYLRSHADESIVVPTTVDMLKDDICFKFFITFRSSVDTMVLECAQASSKYTYLDNLSQAMAEDHQSKDSDHPNSDHPNWSLATHLYLQDLWQNPPNHLPMNVMGRLRFDTVYSPTMEAVARWPPGAHLLWKWWKHSRRGLVEETVLRSGWSRFTLTLREKAYLAAAYDRRFRLGWLSQASRVFDAIGVTEEKENFFVVHPPELNMQWTRRRPASRILHNHIEETPPAPIYLFLHPLPMSISEFMSWMEGRAYFWSFDHTGQSRMSEEQCERWGLPVLTLSTYFESDSVELRSWLTHTYTALRDWQKARGFDPATSEWAQSMGDPEFEIVGARKVQEEKKAGSSWWEAIVGSGISAVGI